MDEAESMCHIISGYTDCVLHINLTMARANSIMIPPPVPIQKVAKINRDHARSKVALLKENKYGEEVRAAMEFQPGFVSTNLPSY